MTIQTNLAILSCDRTQVVHLYHSDSKSLRERQRGVGGKQIHRGRIGAHPVEELLVRMQQPFSLLQILIVLVVEQVGSDRVEVVENGRVAV